MQRIRMAVFVIRTGYEMCWRKRLNSGVKTMPFRTQLDLWDMKPILGSRRRITQFPLTYHSKHWNMSITVPVKYETDLASVPRLAWWLIAPDDPGIRLAAVIHDYCYSHQCHRMTRKIADQILFEAMGEVPSPGSKWLRWIVYFAVRIGGKGNW
ncbi:DUF1353 domain-containing protein [Aliamphritea ceti]|uniref:DUF1353 domain-containing protein n=1 Tax=Aliamphritea ceti TaxID=1524258 RepID=UPI0035E41511